MPMPPCVTHLNTAEDQVHHFGTKAWMALSLTMETTPYNLHLPLTLLTFGLRLDNFRHNNSVIGLGKDWWHLVRFKHKTNVQVKLAMLGFLCVFVPPFRPWPLPLSAFSLFYSTSCYVIPSSYPKPMVTALPCLLITTVSSSPTTKGSLLRDGVAVRHVTKS